MTSSFSRSPFESMQEELLEILEKNEGKKLNASQSRLHDEEAFKIFQQAINDTASRDMEFNRFEFSNGQQFKNNPLAQSSDKLLNKGSNFLQCTTPEADHKSEASSDCKNQSKHQGIKVDDEGRPPRGTPSMHNNN